MSKPPEAIKPPSSYIAWQQAVLPVVNGHVFEIGISVVIFFNLILLIIEADSDARGEEPAAFVHFMNIALLIFYTLEVALRCFAKGLSFFHDPWQLLDFAVVASDVTFQLLGAMLGDKLPSMAMMRMMKLLRLANSHLIIQYFPELNMQVQCLIGSLKSLLWGGVIVCFTLVVWSILAVQLIHPLNKRVAEQGLYAGCDRCPHAFESVFESALTFSQQIVAGDSWGTVTVPIINEAPITAVYFGLVFVSLNMALMNVVLASVVDSANQARASNTEYMNQVKADDRKAATANLMKVCEQLDVDKGGTLTKEEMMEGFEHNHDFQAAMADLDIEPKEMGVVWDILDEDHSGSVDYREFTEQLHKMKQKDSHTMLVFIKHYIGDIRKKVNDELALVRDGLCGQMDKMNDLQLRVLTRIESLEKEDKVIAEEILTIEQHEEAEIRYMSTDITDVKNQIMSPTSSPGGVAAITNEPRAKGQPRAKAHDAPPPQATKQLLIVLQDMERQIRNATLLFSETVGSEDDKLLFGLKGNFPLTPGSEDPRSSAEPPGNIDRMTPSARGQLQASARSESSWPQLSCRGCQGPGRPLVIAVAGPTGEN